MKVVFKNIAVAGALMTTLLLNGCAHLSNGNGSNPEDPYEHFNRKMYQFNTDLSDALLKPVVKVYDTALPKPARTGVHNFIGNIMMVPTITNDALQANFRYMFRDMARFVINTTLGLFGTVDVASDIGLQPRVQSFGLTLAKWGIRKSPYVMLPFLGPSTVRGSFGLIPDLYMNPLTYVLHNRDSYIALGVQFIQNASDVLPREDLITSMAIDPYIAVRSAYLQNRQYLINKIVNETPDNIPEGGHADHHNLNVSQMQGNFQLA